MGYIARQKLSELEPSVLEKLKASKNDANLFCKYFMRDPKYNKPFEFTWYQQKFLKSNKRFVMMNAGRQVGKSELIVKYSIWKAFTTPRFKILLVSRSQRQASYILHRVRQDIEASEVLSKSIKRASRTEVHLDNGSFIVSLPPSRQTILGYTADMIFIDEAAHFTDDSIFYEALMPMIITTQGRIVMTSTPYGTSGFYYECYTKWLHQENAEVLHFPAVYKGKPLSPRVSMEDIENHKTMLGPIRFAVEYLAEFIDDGVLFFPTALVRKVTANIEELSSGNPDAIYYMGIDWGKQKSSTVVTVIEKRKLGASKVVHIKEFKQTSYDTVIGYVAMIAERFNIKKCLADTGSGLAQIDSLKAMGLKIEGFNFTVKSKVELFSFLRREMEIGDIELPENDKLRAQLVSFKQELTPHGNLKLHAPEGMHDDYVDSLALAVFNLKKGIPKFFFYSLAKRF